MIEYNMILCQ